jgi:hypothetical protein
MELVPAGRQCLHINFVNIPAVLLSPNTPAKLMNLSATFSRDCKVYSDIYRPMIAFYISKMVLWQNLYVF